jgi:hypothetical protein
MFVRGHWTERMLLALPFTFNDDNVSLTTVMDTKIRIHIGGGETRDAPATEGTYHIIDQKSDASDSNRSVQR